MAVNTINSIHNTDKKNSGIDANPMYLVFMAMANAADTQQKTLDPLYAQNSELYEQYVKLQKELEKLNDQLNEENSKLQNKELSSKDQNSIQAKINELQQEVVQKRTDIEKIRGKMEVLWQSGIQGTQSAVENMIKMAGIFLGNYNKTSFTIINKS